MTKLSATAAAIIAAAVAVLLALTGPPATAPARSQAPPEIYGTTAPLAAPAPPRLPSGGRAASLRIARQWTAAWGRATSCQDAAADLRRVLDLSTGDLLQALTSQPPRPTAGPSGRCRPPHIKHVRIYATDEGWLAIATRHGDGLRPLRLRLTTTSAGPRVSAIDF